MASAKIATLVVRTLAKPISSRLKFRATEKESFRNFCVGLAQRMYRIEVTLRTKLLGEPAKHIRPLSEARAIENGANALAEGFLFSVAAVLILSEAYRQTSNTSKRKMFVDDQLDDLNDAVDQMQNKMAKLDTFWEEEKKMKEELTEEMRRERERSLELSRILTESLEIQARSAKKLADLQAQAQLLVLQRQSEEVLKGEKDRLETIKTDTPADKPAPLASSPPKKSWFSKSPPASTPGPASPAPSSP